MGKIAIGLGLGLAIGAACRWFDIPVPSPPKVPGALLVLAMTIGYVGTDWLIAARLDAKRPATTQHLCGGPTGSPAAGGARRTS
jgi:XapX domain-containing protein